MGEAHIAAKYPAKANLEAAKIYAWCACGLSKNQPFCDGSHKAGKIRPKTFKVEKSAEVWLCQCKQTSNSPYCDGTHKTL
jgi:CDGSH-type Zn-finger protein